MVTDVELAEVLNNTKHLTVPEKHALSGKPYLGLQEAIIFLAKRGYQYGTSYHWEDGVKFGANNLTLQINNALDCVAILTVKSNLFTGLHSVVWAPQTQEVFDPQDDAPQSLSRYTVMEWAIISKFNPNI
jgi:hypothetical protein